MNKPTVLQKRTYYLTKLARSLYESAAHEHDKERLELHRQVAVETASLFNEAINEDNILHPDLGLELLLFIKLKASGEPEAETGRKYVLSIIERLEKEIEGYKDS